MRSEVKAQRDEILDLRSGRIPVEGHTSGEGAQADGATAAHLQQLQQEIEELRGTIEERDKQHATMVAEMQSAYAEKAGDGESSPEAGSVAALLVCWGRQLVAHDSTKVQKT